MNTPLSEPSLLKAPITLYVTSSPYLSAMSEPRIPDEMSFPSTSDSWD